MEKLTPIENYKYNGVFPYMFIIHFLLIIFTTMEAILIVSETTSYTRAQERLIYNLFIENSPKTDVAFDRYIYLYSVSEVKNHLNQSIQNYFGMKDKFLEEVKYTDDLKSGVKIEFNYIDNSLIRTNKYKTTSVVKNHRISREFIYNITSTNLGPFQLEDSDIKSFLNDVVDFKINYKFMTYVPKYYYDSYDCYHWVVTQTYTFVQRAHFISKLNIYRNVCVDLDHSSLFEKFVNKLMWIDLVVMSLAIASALSSWRYIHQKANELGRPRKDSYRKVGTILPEYDDDEGNEIKKPLREYENENEKNKDFDMWSVICLISNIIQLFGAGLSIFDSDNVLSSTELLIGFGCLLAYLNIGRYIELYKDYSTIFDTIKRSLPNVLRYLLGVIPIFLGFIFFGLCLFWRSERFNSPSSTMQTLFALLNGDSVFDTFRELSGFSFFLGQIYCYLFCIMFLVVVMNVFIAIVEEAYITLRMNNKNHWLYLYLKLDPSFVEFKQKPKKTKEIDGSGEKLITFGKNEENDSDNNKVTQYKNGIDFQFYKIHESIDEIQKIIKESDKNDDDSLRIKQHYKNKLEELEKKITNLKEN